MKLVATALACTVLGLVGCNKQEIAIDPGGPNGPGGIGGFPEPGGPGFVGPQPVFGPVVNASTRPAPLTGGTLAILHDGVTAVAADPDRNAVYLVDLTEHRVRATLALAPGDEPGRLVEDAAGNVHVATRRAGVLVKIDPKAGAIVDRRTVCPLPRGVAYDSATDLVHVACAGGELVSLPAAGGAATRTVQLTRDLRDVVVSGNRLVVSTFRTAQLTVLDANGGVIRTMSLMGFADFSGTTMTPAVAWRMRALPDGRIAISHQLGTEQTIVTTQPGGYAGGGSGGGGCVGITASAVSIFDPATLTVSPPVAVSEAPLPVDVAWVPAMNQTMIVASGNSHTASLTPLVLVPQSVSVGTPDMGTGTPPPPPGDGGGGCQPPSGPPVAGEITSVAVDSTGNPWVLSREPARLTKVGDDDHAISLSTDSRADTGWAVFHSNSGAGVTCASCHPEGGEDSRTWDFDVSGRRRTQSLRGKISGTEPFHWAGDLPTFDTLVDAIYQGRMAGPFLAVDARGSLSTWIDSIPALPAPAPANAAAVAHGQKLFEDSTQGACSSCHSGPEHTDNQTVDVGTGGRFQVPRLVGVGWRAPFLHDGCAATLTDRFVRCGGGDSHGLTSKLAASDISDLVAYLNTL